MKSFYMAVLSILVSQLFSEEISKYRIEIIEKYAAFNELKYNEQTALVQFDPTLNEEKYLKDRFKRIGSVKLNNEKVKGEIKTENLYAIIIEEKPNDLDPILFMIKGGNAKILLNITTLRGSGLEKDSKFVDQWKKINEYCDSLKNKK